MPWYLDDFEYKFLRRLFLGFSGILFLGFCINIIVTLTFQGFAPNREYALMLRIIGALSAFIITFFVVIHFVIAGRIFNPSHAEDQMTLVMISGIILVITLLVNLLNASKSPLIATRRPSYRTHGSSTRRLTE